MESLLQEVKRALDAKFYHLALVLVLTLPDICAALESPDGESRGERYRKWYDANMATQYPHMTATDMWKLRCGVIHQGRCGHPDMQYARIIFTMPNAAGTVSHNRIISDALNLDLVIFSWTILHAVGKWLEANQHNAVVQGNLPKLLQFRGHGLPPYIAIDMPVIA